MGDLRKNISKSETKCRCGRCAVYIQDHEPILDVWQDVCDHFAAVYGVDRVRLEVTSAARCYAYNRIPDAQDGPGSNDESQHPRCTAIDGRIYVGDVQVPTKDVYDYLDSKYPDSHGVGLYGSFTHADTRPPKARW